MLFSEYPWPSREGITPFKHQVETFKFLLMHKRAFVLNDLGTGKTLSVLWFCDWLFRQQKIVRVLVACPLSTMRSVWAKEIFFNFPYRRHAIAHGSRDQRISVLRSPAEIVIINHDGVKVVFEELMATRPDILIIDELTAYKSHNTDRTKLMTKLSHAVPCVIGMTGEPTPNSPLEAYSQARLINPLNPKLPRFFTQYRDATMYKVNDYLWLPKPEAPQQVIQILQPAIRYRRDECLDLPPTMYETLEVPFSEEQKIAYEKMKREAFLQFETGKVTAANAAIVLNKLLQISAGSVKLNDGSVEQIDCKPRLDLLMEIYQQTPQKKLVVFTTFVASVQMLAKFFTDQKINARAIYGEISPNQRAEAIKDFQEGDVNVLIIQPQSSAHGISLVAANTTVWFSLIPSNEFYQQANARTVRPGQTRTTLVIRLLSSKAEAHIAEILDRKAKLSEAVLELFKKKEL